MALGNVTIDGETAGMGSMVLKGQKVCFGGREVKKEQETIPPEEVRRQYFEAYEAMLRAEEKMKKLLLEGGYVSE